MPIFNPEPSHILVGNLRSEKGIRVEKDEALYFDNKTTSFFVVEETEHESGPNTSYRHWVGNPIESDDIEDYLEDHPDLLQSARRVIEKYKPKS